MAINFHRWQGLYQVSKAASSAISKMSRDEFHSVAREAAAAQRSTWERYSIEMGVAAESLWYRIGQPYYKLWPAMVDALTDISIDIDGRFLSMPFPCYEVCLPTTTELREASDKPRVKSLLVQQILNANVRNKELPADGRLWTLAVHYQLDIGSRQNWVYGFGVRSGMTLSESFDAASKGSRHYDDTYEPTPAFAKQICKLAIGTAFFGTHNHQMVMPDIPKRFVERYRRARKEKNEDEVKTLERKAKKLHHFGWNIGSEMDLPLPEVVLKDAPEATGPRGELTHGHIRSGHMRLQPYGPRDNPDRYELIFIAPAAVRPDLPMQERVHGFRLRDEVLGEQK